MQTPSSQRKLDALSSRISRQPSKQTNLVYLQDTGLKHLPQTKQQFAEEQQHQAESGDRLWLET